MACQKYQDPDEKNRLPLLLEDEPEIQQNVGSAADGESQNDHLCELRAVAAQDACDHEAQRRQSLQDHRRDVLLPAFRVKKDSCQNGT